MSTNPELSLTAEYTDDTYSVETAQPRLFGAVRHTIGRLGLVLALVAGPTVAETAIEPPQADAMTVFSNDYPDMDAVDCSDPYGVYAWCKGNPPSWLSPRGYGYRNCTDGAAYWVNKYTGVNIAGWGNADTWDTAAAGRYTVHNGDTNDIEPGDIAQSEDGGFGHVGFVTSVTKNANGIVTSFSTAELNKRGLGEYSDPSANTYSSRDASGKFIIGVGYEWDHFIDVNGANKGLGNESISNPPTPTTKIISAILTDGRLMSKVGVDGGWVVEDGYDEKVYSSSSYIGAIRTNGTLVVKDGVTGGWVTEDGNDTEAALSGTRIAAVRTDGTVIVKDGLNGAWTTIDNYGSHVYLSGNYIGVLRTNGVLVVRDGINGGWVTEDSDVREATINGTLIADIRTDNTLVAKDGINGALSVLDGYDAHVYLSGNYIGALRTNGTLVVRDGLGGGWVIEDGNDVAVAISGSLINVIRSNGQWVAKDGVNGGWVIQDGYDGKLVAGVTIIGAIRTDGTFVAKDGVNGALLTETGNVVQAAIS